MSVFNSVKGLRPKKNAFNMSYKNRLTTCFGKLMPVYFQDVVPGTSLSVNTGALARFLALNAPIMDEVNCYVHFWKIPYRLLDRNWTAFIGGELENDADYDPPYLEVEDDNFYTRFMEFCPDARGEHFADVCCKRGELLDMCGYSHEFLFAQRYQGDAGLKVNIRRIQAYALLLKHWYTNEHITPTYRDTYGNMANLMDKIDDLFIVEGNAFEEFASFLFGLYMLSGEKTTLFLHAWSKDYFTAALPNVQSGDPVTLGLSGSAPVYGSGKSGNILFSSFSTDSPVDNLGNVVYEKSDSDKVILQVGALSGGTTDIIKGNSIFNKDFQLGEADLSEATAITINELRVANALQTFKERVMRFGHRYPEYQKGFFNVTPSDARLQLPEWCGGGKFPINISEVEQTSASVSGSPQGNLAGKATGFAARFGGIRHCYAEEESLIIGLAYLQPKQSYCQGISRFLTKLNDRYDYFNPSFEHLGEQEVFKYELYGSADPTAVFGYLPRYSEYRCHLDETHGEFANFTPGGLGYWTLTRAFDRVPSLDASFIYTQPESLGRIFAVPGSLDNILCEFYFNTKMIAPISRYGTPRLLA